MGIVYSRKRDLIIRIVSVALLLSITASARGAHFADYFPLAIGNWWEGEDFVPEETQDGIVMQPAGSWRNSVFDSVLYDGRNAFKYGQTSSYRIFSKSGTRLTVHAYVEDGEEFRLPDYTLGDAADGSVIQTPSLTILVREFAKFPPHLIPQVEFAEHGDLVASYLQIPGLIFTVELSHDFAPNRLNEIVAAGLDSGTTSGLSGGVSAIIVWAPGIGVVAVAEIEPTTGLLETLWLVVAYHLGPDTPFARLEGVVTDAGTGLPVPGARLTVSPGAHVLTSDAVGYFSSDSLAPGTYTVEASAAHYHTKAAAGISIDSESAHRMNVSLEPKAPVVNGARSEAFNDGLTPVLLTAQVAHPEGAGFLAAVAGKLSPIGGSASQALYDDGTHGDLTAGDGIYSYGTTLPRTVPAKLYALSVTAVDLAGKQGFGSISLNVADRVSGTAQPLQPSSLSFENTLGGQGLNIRFAFSKSVSSLKALTADCQVELMVFGPDGSQYGPYYGTDAIDVNIPNAPEGKWEYVTTNQCQSALSYEVETSGSGTGVLAGRVLDAMTGGGLPGATIAFNTGGATVSLTQGYYSGVAVAGTGVVTTARAGYRTNIKTGVHVKSGATTHLNIQAVPQEAPAEAAPSTIRVFSILDPAEDPTPPTQPFAIKTSGGAMEFNVVFPRYLQAVDIHLAFIPHTGPNAGKLMLIDANNAFVEFSGALHAWKAASIQEESAQIPMPGDYRPDAYTLFSLVTTDSATLASFDLSYFTTTPAQGPPAGQNARVIADPSDEPHPLTQPLAVKVAGEYLVVDVQFPAQKEPVSVFLAYTAPGGALYLIKDDSTAERFSGTLRPWREHVTAQQAGQVLSVPVAQMPPGTYHFYSLVTTDPAALSNYDLTCVPMNVTP